MRKRPLLLSCLLSLFLAAVFSACSADTPPTASLPPATSAGEVSPAEDALDCSFLTGLPLPDNPPEGKRAIAVMVNNNVASRPARGLSAAQVLVESRVEGDITRFMALYEDYAAMPTVGPIRSARDQFFQLILPFQCFYLHDGPYQNQPVTGFFNAYNYESLNLQPQLSGLVWRDADRLNAGFMTEETEYTDGAHVASVVQAYGLDDARTYRSTLFHFLPHTAQARTPATGPAGSAVILHSGSYRTLFTYNADTAQYQMSQSGPDGVEPVIDENTDEQLAFGNVLVIFAPMQLYPGTQVSGGLKEFSLLGGVGYYLSRGGYEVLLWDKAGPDHGLRLYTADNTGTPFTLNPGTTYIAIADETGADAFHATIQDGTAAQKAALARPQ